MFTSIKNFVTDTWHLIVARSRTIWGVILSGSGILMDQFPQVQTLLSQVGLKPVYVALAGLAAVIYARRDDLATGKNPQ